MIEVQVPQDIRKIKTKAIGPFNIRQVICLVVAVILDIIAYACIIRPLGIPVNAIVYIVIFIDVPVFIFSFEVRGLTMEKFLFGVLIRYFITPAKRRSVKELSSRKKVSMTDKERKKRKKELKKLIKKNPEIKPI